MTTRLDAEPEAQRTRGPSTRVRRRDPSAIRDDSFGPRWLAHVFVVVVLAAFATVVLEGIEASELDVFEATPYLLMLTVLIAVGWLLAWKRPGNPLGWLLLLVPGLFCFGTPAVLIAQAIQPTAPDVAAWLYWYGYEREDTWAWIPPVWLLLTQIPLRFPDGRLPSRGWRWFSRFTFAALIATCGFASTISVEVAPGVANPIHVATGEAGDLLFTVGALGLLLLPSFAGSIVSLIARYRRADAVQKAQLRWVFWGVSIAIGSLVLSWVIPFEDWDTLQNWVLLFYGFIPASIAVAVLRYHLYDIDRIISRTASYAIVTLVVVGVYALVVLSISSILPGLPSVGVALATLAAAALFLPVLRSVRGWVDRRFDRARYNAQAVVEAFGERLRNGADPHTAAVDLSAAVNATLQPTAMGLWRPGTRMEESADRLGGAP